MSRDFCDNHPVSDDNLLRKPILRKEAINWTISLSKSREKTSIYIFPIYKMEFRIAMLIFLFLALKMWKGFLKYSKNDLFL